MPNQSIMCLTTESPNLRAFWLELLPLCKLYALYLGGVAIYTLFSLSRILISLRSFKNQAATNDHKNSDRLLALMRNKSDNLSQLTFLSTLLFALAFFLQMPANFRSLVDSSLTGWDFIFHGLAIYFDFAVGVFLVLIILHIADWIVSAHLRRLTLHH